MRWELDQVVNFKLDGSKKSVLLGVISKWIGKKVSICLKLEGRLTKVDKNEGYILIILSEPAAEAAEGKGKRKRKGKGKAREYKIKIDKVKFVECYHEMKPPKNFII